MIYIYISIQIVNEDNDNMQAIVNVKHNINCARTASLEFFL